MIDKAIDYLIAIFALGLIGLMAFEFFRSI